MITQLDSFAHTMKRNKQSEIKGYIFLFGMKIHDSSSFEAFDFFDVTNVIPF